MSEKKTEKTPEDLNALVEAGNKVKKQNTRRRRTERDNVPAKRIKKAHRATGGSRSLKEFARDEVKSSGFHRAEAEAWLKGKQTKQIRVKKPSIKRSKSSSS